ncbi:DUF5134 domain-containing protein [Streptomyces sp. NPDC047928]|uniref:DUF5134 domain-containing protein n=1 Tax=unclassified Streptomyces TaxID=2593676 RepID=UPI003724A49C
MHGPATSGWLLAALCALTGAYCLVRLRDCGGAAEREEAAGEAVMGFGMAVMALPAAVVTPPEWSWTVYAVVFGAASLRALWSVRGGGHHLHHLIGSLAMVYMAVPVAGGGHGTHGAPGTGGGGVPLVTGALLAYYMVYVLRAGARLVPAAAGPREETGAGAGAVAAWETRAAPRRGGGGGGPCRRPEVALACRLTMGLGMLAMLCAL